MSLPVVLGPCLGHAHPTGREGLAPGAMKGPLACGLISFKSPEILEGLVIQGTWRGVVEQPLEGVVKI